MGERTASVARKTKETDIQMRLCLDGRGTCDIHTGIGFFDHMLEGFARHGLFDLDVRCKGDMEVDSHHTVEDVGIVLGQALKEALGEKTGIKRFGSCTLPMDEALILCAVDLSGRPFFVSDLAFSTEKLGSFDTEMIQEFFYALSYSAGMNLHFVQHRGSNSHHIAEAAFKSLGKALCQAVESEPRISGVWSTKGTL